MLVALLVLACAPKPAPPVAAPPPPAPAVYVPAPPVALAVRPFVPSEVHWGKLAAGTPVGVVENHEVPFVSLSIELPANSTHDPATQAGLAEAAMDMLNEGAGKRDAAGISAELRRLGASLGSSSGVDGSSLSVSCLHDQLLPTLDLLADVALRPTFPAKEWDLRRKLWIDDLAAARTTPNRIADRVMSHRLWGEVYRGAEPTEASLEAISVRDLSMWHKANVSLSGALVLVGGDTTLAEIVPLLEARFGAVAGKKAPTFDPPPSAPVAAEKTTVYLVDKPGSAQSVVRAGVYVGKPTDPDYAAFTIANMAIGGQFASRVNLNLREDKGYTYGARTSVGYDRAGLSWSFSSGIHTEHTADALRELFAELRAARGERPLTDKEVADARGALLGGFPLRFETPDYLLGQQGAMRTYGLPADWVSGYLARTSAVGAAQAQAAWTARIDPDRLTFVVVGDAARIRPDIEALGLVVVPTDVDGTVIGAK